MELFNFDIESMINLGAAAGLCALIGLEREFHGQPAGTRTHMILGLGAALAAILSIAFSKEFSPPNIPSDPARIVAQVVSGVGFLGAGAILRFGVTVKGLTTASSLWTCAIIGIACGAGYYYLALITTILVLSALTVIDKFQKFFIPGHSTREISLTVRDRKGLVNDLRENLTKQNISIISLSAKIGANETLNLDMIVRVPNDVGMDSLINIVNTLEDMESVSVQ